MHKMYILKIYFSLPSVNSNFMGSLLLSIYDLQKKNYTGGHYSMYIKSLSLINLGNYVYGLFFPSIKMFVLGSDNFSTCLSLSRLVFFLKRCQIINRWFTHNFNFNNM